MQTSDMSHAKSVCERNRQFFMSSFKDKTGMIFFFINFLNKLYVRLLVKLLVLGLTVL